MTPEEIKHSIEKGTGISPDDLTREMLEEAGCWYLVCALPKDFNERVRHLGNTLAQMMRNIKDDRLRATIGTLFQSISYLLNSTSWQDQELHDFDLMELQRKLRPFLNQRMNTDA